jgi:hypothetical protein
MSKTNSKLPFRKSKTSNNINMHTLTTNPAVKKGDLIILIEPRNFNKNFEGKILEVTTERKNRTKTNFIAKSIETGLQTTIYYSGPGPADTFVMATREAEVNYLKEKSTSLLEQVEENNKRIEFLEKYETEEDFVADKLEAILTAHSKAGSKKARVSAISEVLKELKQSNLL